MVSRALMLPRTVLAATIALLFACPALANPILVGSVSTLPDDSFLYSYELLNPSTELENVFDVGVFFAGDPLDVSSPTGWDSIAGLGFINWFSLMPENDLPIGQTLTGFSFRSALGPGTIEFRTLGADPVTGDVGQPVSGATVGPAAVPEPGTLCLMALGLAGLVVRHRRYHGA